MAKRGTLEHPKTLHLADILECDECEALGLLEALWQITAKFYHTGKLKNVTPRSLGRAIRTRRDSETVWNALIEARWIDIGFDGSGYVHDWPDHADDTVKKNLKNRHECFELPDGTLLGPSEKRKGIITEESKDNSRMIPEKSENDLRQPEPEPKPEPKPKRIIATPSASPELVESSWETFKSIYPKRNGALDWVKGKDKFFALCQSGTDPAVILEGLQRYREWCDATKTTHTEFVRQVPTWINKRSWLEDFEIPHDAPGAKKPQTVDEMVKESLDAILKEDEDEDGSN
jgi:hypothetical protein